MSEFDEEFRKMLKRMREIERRTREYIEDELRRVAEEIRSEIESVERMLSPSWSHNGYLRPLYSLRDEGSNYVLYIDLPRVDEGTIDVRFVGNKVVIKARLKEETRFTEWSGRGGEIKFNEYREVIELPVAIDPSKVKVLTRKRVVKVIIPKE